MSMRPYNASQVRLSDERAYDIIVRPIVTEKSSLARSRNDTHKRKDSINLLQECSTLPPSPLFGSPLYTKESSIRMSYFNSSSLCNCSTTPLAAATISEDQLLNLSAIRRATFRVNCGNGT